MVFRSCYYDTERMLSSIAQSLFIYLGKGNAR